MPQAVVTAMLAGSLVAFVWGPTRDVGLHPGQPNQRGPDSVVIAARARVVFDVLATLLVERNDLLSSALDPLSNEIVSRLEQNQIARLTTRSISTTAEGLIALILEVANKYVTSEGGRYFLTIELQPAQNQTIVRARPTIVARIRGSGSPLGGRLLPSNGRLERRLLDSLDARVRRLLR